MRLVGLVLLLISVGCASAQLRLGGDPKMHPDDFVVRGWVCANQDEAARQYLFQPSFAWLGPAWQRYMVDALQYRQQGKCGCNLNKLCEGTNFVKGEN